MNIEGLLPRFIIYEDEHLLVVNKPAGLNTHSPSPYATFGIYDYLRHFKPDWKDLAIIHRLDKETSGVLIFSKSKLANKSLTEQFTERQVSKKYILITRGKPPQKQFSVRSHIMRLGTQFKSVPLKPGLEPAETHFKVPNNDDAELIQLCQDWINYANNCHKNEELNVLIAEPYTGRTHQVRLHAADRGCAVLGDSIYGGGNSIRIWLHSAEISFIHPATGKQMMFRAKPSAISPTLALRNELLNDKTDSFRLVHGISDDLDNIYVDKFGKYLLVQSIRELMPDEIETLKSLASECNAVGAYHKFLQKEVRIYEPTVLKPRPLFGETASEHFSIIENGVKYLVSFEEGYSVGIFLDQRDNRRRILTRYIGANFPFPETSHKIELLNTFSYTCAFSVVAALVGMKTVSIDLSEKYLNWGQKNFEINGLDTGEHEFIKGDVFDWLKRFNKKQRKFDFIILDPPTFSHSKKRGAFNAWKDYPDLLTLALNSLKADGIVLACLNTANVAPEKFVEMVNSTIAKNGRKILKSLFVTQSMDFPSSTELPAYLKCLWLRIR